jgi:polysaccharide deacetylase family protein (PEP-CTERM system associated)
VILNAMTIDVEEHFHVSVFDGVLPRHRWASLDSRVCANTERLLGILADYETKATFFVLACVAERFPALVKRIAACGHEIASHGFGHRLIYDQTPRAFREDVRRAKTILEDVGGQQVQGYRAPSYSITPKSLWALDILIEEGYRYDSSVYPIRHDRYGIPESPRHPYVIHRPAGALLEVPGATATVGPLNVPVGGGGYFRILPYSWIHWGISRLNTSEGRAAIFYLHPWEIDPDQPRLRTGLLGGFRHYHNLHKTEARLRRLLTDFRFGPMTAVIDAAPADEPTVARDLALPYVW